MTDDTSIDELYENIRSADIGDDAMGEVRRLVALDKAIEIYRIACETMAQTDVGMTPIQALGIAADIEAFLAGVPFDEEDDDEDLRDGGLQ